MGSVKIGCFALLILFLGVLCANCVLHPIVILAAPESVSPSVTLTKSLSQDSLSKTGSVVVALTITKQGNSSVQNVILTDTVPSVLTAGPKEIFTNNLLQKKIERLGNVDYFTYSISTKNDLELSKDWSFTMPGAQITYKLGNSSQVLSASSNTPNLTLLSMQNTNWTIENWPLYVLTLIAISSVFGAIGGLINYLIKYRSAGRGVTSKTELRTKDYVFEVEYANYIEAGDTCNIRIISYRLQPAGNQVAPEIKCYLFVGGQQEYNFKINIGQDEQHKKETTESRIISDTNVYLKIMVGQTEELEKITIIVAKKSLAKDILAGFAAGLIVLLTLQITTTVVTSEAYPANPQSIITLIVSTLIAGLVPFQILDRATGQLQETVRISREQAANESKRANKADAQKTSIVNSGLRQVTEIYKDVDKIYNDLSPKTNMKLTQTPYVEQAKDKARNLMEFLQGFT